MLTARASQQREARAAHSAPTNISFLLDNNRPSHITHRFSAAGDRSIHEPSIVKVRLTKAAQSDGSILGTPLCPVLGICLGIKGSPYIG